MNLKNPLKTCLFFSLLCFLGSVSIYAYAPDSLADKKMTLTVASKYHDMEWYILEDGTNVWAHEIEDGEWELGNLSWSKTSTYQGTLQSGPDNDYVLITATFTSSNSGTFTYTLHESENGGPVEVVDSGTGSFTLGDYDISDIPFDNYFEDDFTSNQVSQAIWPLGTAYGITIGVKDNALQLTGTLNDEIDDQRWYAFSASSILSTANDWKVNGSSFAKIDVQNDFLNYQAATGVELRNSKTNGLDFEISIGLTPWGIRSEIYVGDYDNYDSQYHSTGVGGGVLQEGDFRVVNDSSNKTITTQYLSGSEWETLYELNWDSGILADKINNSETQLNPWTSFSTEYALPTMDFVIPHTDQDWNGENIQVYSLSDGDLGFKNYSVTETTSEPIPEYAPSSLVGKIYQGSDNDHYQFLDTSKAIFYHKESNFQESEISEITYTWTESGNTGTLTTSLDEITTLTFSSKTEGSSVRQEEGSNNTSSGTFSLADSSAGNAPDDLSGDTIIFGTSTYIFKDNGVVTIRTTTGSEESTYGYVKFNNDAGTLSIPAQTDNASSTLYRMSFSSSSSGTLSEGGSGSFEYFIDGSNQPSSKGWMWFDQYPWVYSEIEQGWIYFYPSGSKLLAFSVKDQAWREME